MTEDLKPDEALARLCNAECMLELAIKALDETSMNTDEWKVSEALQGVSRLLDGCYVTLSDAVNKAAKSAATEVTP
jgi:hypothetical protein